MTDTYYKVLDVGGTAYHGGYGQWYLPKGKRPGKYMTVEGKIVPCSHGLHLCRREDLIHWLGPEIYVAQVSGDIVIDEQKIVTNKAQLIRKLDTWNETAARLFACDCAERVANGNETLLNTISVARRYARGEATEEERYAAWSAAESATRYAAESATRYAAVSAAWSAAESAAWSAAWSAARYAAWSVARYAAWSVAESAAEREWQTVRLFQYLEGEIDV